MRKIPYGRQDIDEADIRAVVDVLRSDFLTQGPAVEAFENETARYCGAKHAIAVSNATAALHVACLAMLKPGQRVWTSPNTFVASSNCALYTGAEVDFVDIDTGDYNMSVEALERKLAAGARPDLLIPVHHSGQSCRMEEIGRLAKKYGFKVMEDASHAIGGKYRGTKIGACEHSDVTVLSFHPVKVMTTGEGGMLLTNDDQLAASMKRLRSHGITRDAALMSKEPDGPWYYEQIELGYNYRLTDIQAALGSSQLKRVDGFVESRHRLASRYAEKLRGLPVFLPEQREGSYSAFHLFVVRLDEARIKKSKKQVFTELQARGVQVNLHYIPVYLQPYYRRLGFGPGLCPNAESYYRQAITLPMFSHLSEADQDYVVESLREVLG